MPERVQLKRTPGWKMPPNTVSVTRPGIFGNPFIVGRDGTQAECVHLFEMMLAGAIAMSTKADPDHLIKARVSIGDNLVKLRGKNLACWCRIGTACHADVLLKIANRKSK